MQERPYLPETTLRAVLEKGFGVPVATLDFLPLGNDLDSFVYRAEATDGARYLLKARSRAAFRPASLLVPRHLADVGVPNVLAPLSTRDGALWHEEGEFALSLYPFLDASTAASAGLHEGQWRALGTTLAQLHGVSLPTQVEAHVPREPFVPSRRERLDVLAARFDEAARDDPLARELAAFWHDHRATIRAVIAECDVLGAALRGEAPPTVLCHADFHGWNVLVEPSGALWIVDWDEVIVAPRERDLMFVIGGIGHGLVSSAETAAFLDGYGDAPIEPRRLRYYRLAWAVADMAAYAEALLFAPTRGDTTRRAALAGFVDLFAPGNIVEIARGTAPG